MDNSNTIIKASGIDFSGSNIQHPGDLPALTPESKIRRFNDFLTFEVSAFVPGANAETSTLYPIFFVANTQCFLLEAKCVFSAAGGASAKVDVEKMTSGVARGSGGSMLKTKFDLTAAANTVISTLASTSIAYAQLAPTDYIALKTSGTLTNARDVCVTLLFGIRCSNIPMSANVLTT